MYFFDKHFYSIGHHFIGKCTPPIDAYGNSLQQQCRLYSHNGNFRVETYQSQFVHILSEDIVCRTVSSRIVFAPQGN